MRYVLTEQRRHFPSGGGAFFSYKIRKGGILCLSRKRGGGFTIPPAGHFGVKALVLDTFGNMALPEDPPVSATNSVDGVRTDEQT